MRQHARELLQVAQCAAPADEAKVSVHVLQAQAGTLCLYFEAALALAKAEPWEAQLGISVGPEKQPEEEPEEEPETQLAAAASCDPRIQQILFLPLHHRHLLASELVEGYRLYQLVQSGLGPIQCWRNPNLDLVQLECGPGLWVPFSLACPAKALTDLRIPVPAMAKWDAERVTRSLHKNYWNSPEVDQAEVVAVVR